MSKYIRHGSNWHVSSDADACYLDTLPVGNYVVKRDQFGNFFLEETPAFNLGRIYGDAAKTADRIIRTFIDRDKNTGVLAVGEKGTGKTLLTKLVSHQAAEQHGIPTILVNDPHHGDPFNSFLACIDGRCVVLFDEFEKSYDAKGQEALLTLFDGVYQMNKLFLLTANSEFSINKCMISRPGRIFYYLEYGALSREFIKEYCLEHLNDKKFIDSVSEVAEIYGNFSFDAIKSLVDEMNRYGEPPHLVLKYLNIKMDYFKQNRRYTLAVTRDGLAVELSPGEDGPYQIDPRQTDFTVDVLSDDGNDDDKVVLEINPDRLVIVKKGGNIITYHDQGYVIIATCYESKRFDPLESLSKSYHGEY